MIHSLAAKDNKEDVQINRLIHKSCFDYRNFFIFLNIWVFTHIRLLATTQYMHYDTFRSALFDRSKLLVRTRYCGKPMSIVPQEYSMMMMVVKDAHAQEYIQNLKDKI